MEFIGIDGWLVLFFKDVIFLELKVRELYFQCILIVRNIYWKCWFVYVDFSEFNMLYEGDKLYVIDVLQFVEYDYFYVLEFFRKDCINVIEFFKKNGVCVMNVRVVDFVIDLNINDVNVEDYFEKV